VTEYDRSEKYRPPEKYPRPEMELLLCCASPAGKDGRTDRIRALSGQSLDWPYLLDRAAAHALTPLLYWGLKALRPEKVSTSLEQSFQDNTRHSVQLTAELFQLMDLLASEGIRALPFKGPTLAMAAYGNLALREFVDLDLLVRQEDALRAREVLLGNGYRSGLELNTRWEEAYLRGYDEFGLLGPDGYPLVELHWAVTPRFFSVPLDIAQFWSRATPVNLGNREVLAPGAEDLLLVLCLHGTKHCWLRLSMVSDMAWLMAASNIRWDAVVERARGLGSLRMLLLGTELAARLLGVPLPEPIVRGVAADRSVQTLAAEVTARLLQTRGPERSIRRAGVFHMRARERWQDRVRYFVRLTTRVGVEDWQAVDLPSSLAFLYLILRLPRLLRKYGMHIP